MNLQRAALVGALSVVFAGAAFGQSRDHVLCYAAKPAKKICTNPADAGKLCVDDTSCSNVIDACAAPTKFPKGVTARLDDVEAGTVGEDRTFFVKKPNRLCIPVDKNGEGIEDPATSYLTYPIKQAGKVCNAGTNQDLPCGDDEDCPLGGAGSCQEIPKFDGKAADNVNILVEDQFTNIRVNASKVDFLMVPASMCEGDDDATCVVGGNAAPAADTEEHFKCYKAKATKTVCAIGAPNALQACAGDADCGNVVDACSALPKFAKGLTATLIDDGGDLVLENQFSMFPTSPERTFGLGKISHFCKAVEKTVPPGTGTPEGPVDPDGRLICYKGKAAKLHCQPGSPANALAPCKKEVDCGGTNDVTTFCDAQTKFSKVDADVLGWYVNDQFDLVAASGPTQAGDYHRVGLSKEDLVCIPACEDPDQKITFTNHVFRATTLEIPDSGHPGDGVNVDGLATCQPVIFGGCSGGIDNVLGYLSGTISDLNTALQDAVNTGIVNIILEVDDFALGAQVINGYTAALDTPPGCTNQSAGAQVCNYVVSGVDVDTRSCVKDVETSLPITIGGLPGSPASVTAAGIGTLTFDIPLLGQSVALTAHQLQAVGSIVHAGGVVSSASGALGGAIVQRELKGSIAALPEGICDGGGNSGDPCTAATQVADCDSDACDTAYLGGFAPASVASLIDGLPRDIDSDTAMTCEGGMNAGEPCTVNAPLPTPGGCPDPITGTPPIQCTPFDAMSIGLKFTAIDAAITGYERPCTKATCSLQ